MELKKHLLKFNGIESYIPYYEIVGKKDGPTIFISGGMHGDEINGVYILGEFMRWFNIEVDLDDFAGRIILLPVLNVLAFESGQRVSPIDSKDLNRQFGETKIETFSEYLAAELTKSFFIECELGVDIHDSGSIAQFIPHSRIHKDDAIDCISCSRNLAKVFGTKYTLEREGEDKMMAVAMNNLHNISIITVEIGGLKQVHPEAKSIGVTGLKNVLIAQGMMKGDLIIPHDQIVITERSRYKSEFSGYINLNIALGDYINYGDLIGNSYNPLTNQWEDILAIDSGMVFSLWSNNIIAEDAVAYSLIESTE
jgi:predicted deacylase